MRIRRLTLATGDLERQAAFYDGRLGLPVAGDGEHAIEVALRDSTIRFERAEPGLDARYHFAINVPGDSIRAAVAWLRERAEVLSFDGDPVRTDVGAGCVYFLDAVGNVLELIAGPHIEGEGSFGPQSLIEIAEIGVASADVEATAAAVRDAFGEPVRWSDSELTAVGDRHAVVIVAPIGRGWIPVDLTARPLPTEIVGDGSEGREVTLSEGPYRLRVAPPPESQASSRPRSGRGR
jgi:catechol 2,3-dioxygenase-like lactoylglutathione lyase family enzyme